MKLERSSLYKINLHSKHIRYVVVITIANYTSKHIQIYTKTKTKQNRANMPKLDLNSKQKFIACVDTGLLFLGQKGVVVFH